MATPSPSQRPKRNPAEPSVTPSMAVYRVGGHTYPMKVSKTCAVCTSAWRAAIENYVIGGYSYEKIAKEIPEAGVTSASVKRHIDSNHLPLAEHAKRRLIERRATELNWDVESGADRLDDHITFLRAGVQKVFSRMAAGEIEPDIKNGISMAKALAALEIGEEVSELRSAQYVEAIRVVLGAVRKHMDNDQFRMFSQEILESPVIQALSNNAPSAPASTTEQRQYEIAKG